MKIITNTAVYVQKIDLEFLKYRLHSLPQTISSKIFENNKLDVDDFDKYDFFKFEDKNDIEFFKGIDWLIDYNSIKDLPTEEITKSGRDCVEKREQITKKLYGRASAEEYDELLLQYVLINNKIKSLNDIIDFKLGLLKIKLPDGIDYPEEIVQKKGIKKLIKSIKKRIIEKK